MKARPTMRDVADTAGVSLKTVSRVVNGETGVSPETLARVSAAIDRIGFRRNDLARSLRPGQSTATIGLVVGDLGNPFFSTIARSVEEVAREHGSLLVTGSTDEDADHERELVATLCARRVDGILLVPSGDDHRYLLTELALGIPLVFLDRPGGDLPVDAVVLDNHGGARAGVEHLLRQGHRRIALLADDPAIPTAGERVRGFRDALAAAGVPPDERLLCLDCAGAGGAEEGLRAMLDLPDPPTAVFAVNNRMSVGAVRALRERPRPPALVGFDDFELADMLPTPITVVAHDPRLMGRAGARALFARLAGDESPPRTTVLPTSLVVRGSGELAP